ncbi:MAG: D-alanyl-D-alanine carboxypeptidase [Alphaproteobacteria bacterium]|nr:D-alanyl-D-alanine carboxypeptidase [Alphaproteobacteria bacterium]
MNVLKILAFVLVLVVALSPQDAFAKRRHSSMTRARHHYVAVDKSAQYSDIVIDADTGAVIHETDATELRHPASLTKMMTLYLTFQALDADRLKADKYLYVSENAAMQPPSKLGLRTGQRIRVEDAILGLVTKSANDAAVVLAEAMGGTEYGFAMLMTRQAQALGMSKTVFRNPSGLPDPEQVTTAQDMAILGAALINHFPKYYAYFGRESFTYGGVVHRNHNHLMDRYEGMDGIKTGYIRASGFNLVASVKRGNRRLLAVVFGGRSAASRDNKMAALLDQGFGKRTTQTVAMNDNDDNEVSFASRSTGSTPQGDAEDADDAVPVVRKKKSVHQRVKTAALRRTAPVSAGAGDGGTWGVQIGAFSNAEAGRKVLENVMSTFPVRGAKPEPQVQKVAAGGTVMYRARLMSLDKETAQNICATLVQHGKKCLTLEP